MSRLLSKLLYGVLIICIAVALISVFREQILTNSGLGKLFGIVLDELPFIKTISDMVTKVLGYNYTPPSLTADHFLEDWIKLAVMTLIRPIFIALVMKFFLPLPPRNQILQTSLAPMSVIYEDYTETIGYKLKALLINIICTIPLALMAGWLIGKFQEVLTAAIGTAGSVTVQIIVLILILGLSIIRLSSAFRRGNGVQKAALWRGSGFIMEMVKTLLTECICVWAYMLLMSQRFLEMLGPLAAFIILCMIIETAVRLMHQAIV